MKSTFVLAVLTILILGVMVVMAQDKHNDDTKLAVQTGQLGLAARYPGDVGLADDPAVVWYEDFEVNSVSDVKQRWTSYKDQDGLVMFLASDAPPNSPGHRSLRMTGTKGQNNGGDLWLLLDEGYDQLYARFYCKFAPDAPYVHHFVHMGGKTSTSPYPEGGAGQRPTGHDRFSTSIDLVSRDVTDPPGAWAFYSYWCEMRSWQTEEGVSDGRPSPYYGNLFGPIEPLQAKRDEWQCVEIMIKLNDPDKRNGEQALWVDGQLVERYGPGTIDGTWLRATFWRDGQFNTDPQPFEGFRWRTTDRLKINTFWLQYYLASVFQNDWSPSDTTIPYNDDKAVVYFDNVVLATEYIGPIASAEKPTCDYDGDGQAGLSDVIRLLGLCTTDPPGGSADYNGDGRCNVMDAMSLLIDITLGKC